MNIDFNNNNMTINGHTTFNGEITFGQNYKMSSQDVNLYVSTSGNDSNDGTINNPLLTFQEVFSRIPPINGNVRIHFSSGSFSISPNVNSSNIWSLNENYGGTSTRAIFFEGQIEEIGIGLQTPTAGTTTTIIETNQSLILDQYQGYMVLFVSGALAGTRRLIGTNSINGALSLLSPLSSVPTASDKFNICKISTDFTWNSTGNNFPVFLGRFQPIVFRNIRFKPSVSGQPLAFKNVYFNSDNTEFDMQGSFVGFESCVGNMIGVGSNTPFLLDQTYLNGVGSIIKNTGATGGLSLDACPRFVINGCVFNLASVQIIRNSAVLLSNFYIKSGSIDVIEASLARGSSSPASVINTVYPGKSYGILVDRQCHLNQTSINFQNITGSGIIIRENSHSILGSITGNPTQYGVKVLNQSRLQVNSGNTISGSMGEILVGGKNVCDSWSNVSSTTVTDLAATNPQLCSVGPTSI
jgi:hypothetical protein